MIEITPLYSDGLFSHSYSVEELEVTLTEQRAHPGCPGTFLVHKDFQVFNFSQAAHTPGYFRGSILSRVICTLLKLGPRGVSGL